MHPHTSRLLKTAAIALCTLAGVLAPGSTAALAATPERPEGPRLEVHLAHELAVVGVLNPGKKGVAGTYPIDGYEFLYRASKTECQGGARTPQSMSLGGGEEAVRQEIKGLLPGTEYTFCLAVREGSEESVSPPSTFKTAIPPEVPQPLAAEYISGTTTAILRGVLNPGREGEEGEYWFEYRASASECQGAGAHEGSDGQLHTSGEQAQTVETTVAGLLPSTTYTFCLHYRQYDSEEAVGPTSSFTTPATVPLAPVAVSAPGLPDNRAYEQVTPVDKNGLDALGAVETVHAAPSGDAVSFFSTGALPGSLGADAVQLNYVAMRQDGIWATHGMAPPASTIVPGGPEVLDVFPDLSKIFVMNLEPELAPGAAPGEHNVYEQDVATGAYQFLVSDPEERFAIAGVTPDDKHFVFEDRDRLVSGAVEGARNLYESNEGRIDLVSVLPAAEGGIATAPVAAGAEGALFEEYTQEEHVLSADGSRVFFTAGGNEDLYVRESADTPQASTVKIAEGARFQTATADGELVLFTKQEDLYAYHIATGQTDRLTVNGRVDGVLGMGGEGDETYVYFAAEHALAGGVTGQPNIYMAHYDGTEWKSTYIATLGTTYTDLLQNSDDWRENFETTRHGEKLSRVTPDGKTLLFASASHLTDYENAGHYELYLYDAQGGPLTCISCNPSGEPATADAYLSNDGAKGGLNGSPSTAIDPKIVVHNLTASGSSVFFETSEALLPTDTNGASDVYEWERDGAGSCAESGGCLFLISTGESTTGAYLADASASGDDVFFFTGQQIAAADKEDELQDIYDARVDGAVTEIAAAACSGTGCQGVPPAPPIFATPASVTYAGVGNFPPAVTKAKPKAKAKHKHKTKRGRKRARKPRRGARSLPKAKPSSSHSRQGGR
jgi:Tol biopolymer transport system component